MRVLHRHARQELRRPWLRALVLAAALTASAAFGVQPESGRAAAAGTHSSSALAVPAQAPGSLCGQTATAPSWRHVIWIFMENHSYSQIIGNSAAPFLNSLAATCSLVTDYHNITHPSLPNYLAATSGLDLEQGSDCLPTACPLQARSLFAQVASSGRQWRSYEESMSSKCQKADGGGYIAHHNPATYYTSVAAQCARWDIPMGSASGGNFLTALKNNTLPAFSFVTPNQCHIMGSCGITAGDNWLASWFSVIAASAAYKAGHTAIFVTFDEGAAPHYSTNCVTASTADCHVATWVVAPSVPHGRRSGTATLYTHYSLLLTTEQMLGIATHLGGAAGAASLRWRFNL